MDPEIKKATLRMIPYGIYILTTSSSDRTRLSAAAINWLTQCSFQPPLVGVGVKKGTLGHTLLEESQRFALHFLAKDQARFAFDFFKETQREGERVNGHPFTWHSLGVPILSEVPAYFVAELRGKGPDLGDHTLFVAEVVDAYARTVPQGRLEDAIAWLKDLGEKVYYGG